MNKSIKRLFSVLLAVLVLAALSVSALAEGDTYTVRIFAGNVEGASIEGKSVWTYTGSYGAGIPFDLSMVSLPSDSQYSVRGVRESGLDNNQISPLGTITEDADYVVAYGITGQLVAYTVNFVDEDGNALADSQTYYGNVGDKPVVAYLYIDGYQPQALNLAKTLVENEAENVFTFRYSEIVVVTPEPAVQPTPYVYTEGAETPAEGEEAAPAEGEEEVEPAPEPEEAVEPAPEPETEEITEEDTPLNNAPQQLIDLDEEDTPLGSAPVEREKTELQQERERTERNLYVAAGLLGVALIAIAVLVVLLVRRRGAKS